jgi:hypothetical protein
MAMRMLDADLFPKIDKGQMAAQLLEQLMHDYMKDL